MASRSLRKDPKPYYGEKKASSKNASGKTGCPHAKD
jgi:hypothetical protein